MNVNEVYHLLAYASFLLLFILTLLSWSYTTLYGTIEKSDSIEKDLTFQNLFQFPVQKYVVRHITGSLIEN